MFDGRIEGQFAVPAGSVLTVTNSGGGPTAITIPSAAYYLTAAGGVAGLLATLQALLIASRPPSAGTWIVSMSTGPSGTGKITINCNDGALWSIVWTDTNLRDLLGFSADIVGATNAFTAPKQARGLWMPDTPLRLDGDIPAAPKVTDLRTSISPTFKVLGIKGNKGYRFKNVRWTKVPRAKYREAAAAIPNASYETFLNDVQLGEGHTWFVPVSLFQIYGLDSGVLTLVGGDANAGIGVAGWQLPDISSIEPPIDSPDGWTGFWRVEWPLIVSSG